VGILEVAVSLVCGGYYVEPLVENNMPKNL